MKSSGAFKIFIFLGLLSLAEPQTVNIDCLFILGSATYMCVLNFLTIADNPSANFVIGGEHQPGLSNVDVNAILTDNSDIPFVITQLFTEFPNVEQITITNSGLTRIEPNSFSNARNARFITISQNPQLRSIPENAFSGLANVEMLALRSNGIESIREGAFNGLTLVTTLFLDAL